MLGFDRMSAAIKPRGSLSLRGADTQKGADLRRFLLIRSCNILRGAAGLCPAAPRNITRTAQRRAFGERRSLSRMKRMSAGRKMHSDTKKLG